MPVPQVAIVGRPNVGKSSLFNWLARRRLAIVDNYEGVTRDRMTTLIETDDRYFELVDTGGVGVVDADDLTADVKRQIEMAINSADVILLVVDIKTGVMPLDTEVVERLRGVERPVILVVNKADEAHQEIHAEEFRSLGRGMLIPVSTMQNRGRDDLMQAIVDRLPADDETLAPESAMKITIVGRRNVGKSTFVNTLAESERMIVSEVAGTTRDSVDVNFEVDGQTFTAIDTPGLRKRKSVRTDLEWYSTHRAARSVRRADVVLMFFDATQKTSKVDKQLVGYVMEHHKPVIFVVNKWDLYSGQVPTEQWVKYLRHQFTTLSYAPIAFITGQSGKNVKTLLNHAAMLHKQAKSRVSTGELNRVLRAAVDLHPPPLYQNRRAKIFFATQVSTEPPTIVLMCTDPNAFGHDYQRYILGWFRDHLPFGEVPIKLYFQKRTRAEEEAQEGKSKSR
ncbi:ribosome biogenesis GTPase Der [Aporhodopirellula aestuarii]|uniref:GTPase Der n=1 Tax=Aporhodopirellula aestuarii TaxID=2950107 RepID=A0ABT0U024_9BACT|nr:ribosome biogenesis GTPase Der [Aporhodopirellula aestuarii]MCM2370175.1 ribosome biogenesis GTPase Der [Aporhodopirellula aestuarii]